MALAVQLIPGGRHAQLLQMLPGGCNGSFLHVKADYLSFRRGDAAQKGRVAAVAAGSIDAKARLCQPRGQKVLHELDGGQVRRAAAHQLPAFCRKAELCPERKLCGIGGQRGGKYGSLFAVVSGVGAQGFF